MNIREARNQLTQLRQSEQEWANKYSDQIEGLGVALSDTDIASWDRVKLQIEKMEKELERLEMEELARQLKTNDNLSESARKAFQEKIDDYNARMFFNKMVEEGQRKGVRDPYSYAANELKIKRAKEAVEKNPNAFNVKDGSKLNAIADQIIENIGGKAPKENKMNTVLTEEEARQKKYEAEQDAAAKEHQRWLKQTGQDKYAETKWFAIDPIMKEVLDEIFIEDFGTDREINAWQLHESCPHDIAERVYEMLSFAPNPAHQRIIWRRLIEGCNGSLVSKNRAFDSFPYGTVRHLTTAGGSRYGVIIYEQVADDKVRTELLRKRREELELYRDGEIKETSWMWARKLISKGCDIKIENHYPSEYKIEIQKKSVIEKEKELKKIEKEKFNAVPEKLGGLPEDNLPTVDPIVERAIKQAKIRLQWMIDNNKPIGIARTKRVISTLEGETQMTVREANRHYRNVKRWGKSQALDMWIDVLEAFEILGVR